jgi:transcriptional regulator with XRE-family HTH domain
VNYGERIKEVRLSRDLRQAETAIFFGVSTSAIGSYERCERQPPFEFLVKYADYFEVSLDYLLGRSDEKLTAEAYQQQTTLDLSETLQKHSITLDGVELTADDKKRVLDIATVLLFDKLT